MQSITKVICIKNTLEIDDEVLVNDMVQIGKIYDMQRIYYTGTNQTDVIEDNSWDLWNCYIYDGDNIWRLPLEFFEPLDEYRSKKINNILEN